eukprot:CAMPEP_0177162204 /NCGR_PEP_ID=MMETSP0367-20130122/5764_1 /TAXON_ID=447022 ORGANISM="Scrippsiella hangoei-like, Strain SHHI-4" /NCGR_SAMPLE_ID=MMETSP0367 /ASSEMBLY_ACC=CAM_ASM_000362 /LENGTH=227 /DNA_ID=CAMNT_0018607967 /DNA_START=57 /DNA_END=740 /DNA_ORIENTATION=-
MVRSEEVQRKLFFRGRHITESTIQDLLETRGLSAATDIVMSGCSSGGANIIAHLDYLRTLLPASARVVGFADSGFYLDVEDSDAPKRFLVAAIGQNGTHMLNQRCLENYTGAEQKCLMGVIAAGYLATPLYLWQSRYDSNQEYECWNNRQCFLDYGKNITFWINATVLSKPSNGAFIDSCTRHCPSGMPFGDRSGKNVMDAFAQWYSGGERFDGQLNDDYPCKNCCT